MEQSRGFAIILRTLALDAGIYHGISPVSSGTQHVANGSEGQTADCTYTYVRLVTFDFRLSTFAFDFASGFWIHSKSLHSAIHGPIDVYDQYLLQLHIHCIRAALRGGVIS